MLSPSHVTAACPWLGRGIGGVGTMPGVTVTVVPYPESCRSWVLVEWEGRGATPDTATYAPGEMMFELMVRLAVHDLDYRDLRWAMAPDLEPSERNPFVGRAA